MRSLAQFPSFCPGIIHTVVERLRRIGGSGDYYVVIMSTMSILICVIWKGSEELRDLVLFRICLICLICLFISGVVLS